MFPEGIEKKLTWNGLSEIFHLFDQVVKQEKALYIVPSPFCCEKQFIEKRCLRGGINDSPLPGG